ncbi:MAG TPA: hypothetical protein VFO45_08310 [Sphingomicrobium sp.]|nr:hypothetical protein [Sphingomicrobium sp.]
MVAMLRISVAALLIALPTAAGATGGFTCSTAGRQPIVVSVAFGHVPGAALLEDSTRLFDRGRKIPVRGAQWWFDGTELRLLLTDPNALRREVIVKTRRNGRSFDGDLWRAGKRYWVRCRES